MTKQARNSITVQYMLRGLEEMLHNSSVQSIGVQASAPPPATAAHKRHHARRGGQ
jgi:hypothetical protein